LLAIEDFQKAADLYWKEGKLAEHKDARERILVRNRGIFGYFKLLIALTPHPSG
jgi:hypothetical protein